MDKARELCVSMITTAHAVMATTDTKPPCTAEGNSFDQKTKDLIDSVCKKAIAMTLRKNRPPLEIDAKIDNECWGNTLHICVETAHPNKLNRTQKELEPTRVSIHSTTLGSRMVLSVSIDKDGKPDLRKAHHYEAPNRSTDWYSRLNELYVTITEDHRIFEADKKIELLRCQQSNDLLFRRSRRGLTTQRLGPRRSRLIKSGARVA